MWVEQKNAVKVSMPVQSLILLSVALHKLVFMHVLFSFLIQKVNKSQLEELQQELLETRVSIGAYIVKSNLSDFFKQLVLSVLVCIHI